MTDASLALQIAMRTRLVACPALTALVPAANILDHGPASRFPSIIIGEGQTVLDGSRQQTFARDMSRVFLDAHLWTKTPDLGSVKMIAGAVRKAILASDAWTVEDHRLIDLTIPTQRFMRDREGETPLAHGVVMIAALLQEVAPA